MKTVEARIQQPGGGFLIAPVQPEDVFTPEDLSEEHRMVRKAAGDFFTREVMPRTEQIERQDWNVTKDLLRRLGELGFLAPDLPEAYGGGGMDSLTSLVIAEQLAAGSFSVTYGVQVGIGMLPIAFFGNDEQKRRYLPTMARAERFGAYALTEPTSGSDALSMRTRAVRSPDGQHFLLSGQKQFITNSAIADTFIVYAKVDGEHITAFIVDRGTEGFTVGEEEHKLGVKGSSTRGLFFENAKVPTVNVLGEIGQGHKVALNILNMGRFKLGAACMAGAKQVLRQSTAYALERRQFGRPIAEFGLIRQKLAQMAVDIYAAESMVYRTGGLVEGAVGGIHGGSEVVRSLEEYAVEASINKIFASELLDRAVDEMVQVYGGYGFIEDYPAARAYRDARINRIWEGTNEINRLLIMDMLAKRAMKGRLNLLGAVQQVVGDLTALGTSGDAAGDGALAEESALAEQVKRAALLAMGVAVQKYLDRLEHEQEIVAAIADLVIEAFATESAVLRARKAHTRGETLAPIFSTMARAYLYGALPRVEMLARHVLAATDEGDTLRTELAGLRRLVRYTPVNLVALQRDVAAAVLKAGGYVA